ncbi:putative Acyl CoA binding protein [Blattamonas nauphoetae]|uniref:Acyl CoA binding protein n=1 Tax=Blattamonas nauphoetae TaxID=2049346 RepID=A0ABQ9WQU4_9EUKA|nr:putative Acyl CoA binding protein [Blattamonas nauphoetae]
MEAEFQTACDWMKDNAGKISKQEDLLPPYGFFKQATEGDNKTAEPMKLNIKAHRKWDIWKKQAGMSKEDAMKNYVEAVNTLKAQVK